MINIYNIYDNSHLKNCGYSGINQSQRSSYQMVTLGGLIHHSNKYCLVVSEISYAYITKNHCYFTCNFHICIFYSDCF